MDERLERGTEPEDEGMETIALTDDEGNETEFLFLDDVEYDGREFAILVPLTEEDEPAGDEVVILEVIPREDSDEIEAYRDVESEEVLNAVFRVFEANNPELFDGE